MESASFNGGRFVATASSVDTYYHITDHLGSVRAVVDSSGEVKERSDYYPFGLRWEDAGSQLSDNRYRYNGKEEQSFVNVPYTDYGARMYDPELGRWFVQDPMATLYYGTSPYAYCLNNPIKYIDPDGRSPYYNMQGRLVRVDEKGFTGEIYIVESNGETKLMQDVAKLSLEAQSNIYTNVLNHMPDIDYSNLQGDKVSITTNRAVNGVRVTYNDPAETTRRYSTTFNDKNEIVVTAIENAFKTDLHHVEAIQNYLGVHEYMGHGLKKFSNGTDNHWRAYDLQLTHPTFKFMPKELQNEVLIRRKDYMKDENPSRYQKEYGNE